MVAKSYAWEEGATLLEHSRKKHQILREYVYQYVLTRCKPMVRKFRLAVVDGFSGAGRYQCGAAGSPIIFVEELSRAILDINHYRISENLPLLEIECSLILNDADRNVVELLKGNLNPILIEHTLSNNYLTIKPFYSCSFFESIYPSIKAQIKAERHQNIIFNLDQCGHSHVHIETLTDMMTLNDSVEVFYTFMISSLTTFLKQHDSQTLATQLAYLNLSVQDFEALERLQSKKSWLGVAERLVFENFKKCAKFVSPFSINNPNGWRYWLLHLANKHRARQVYNDVLHQNSETQAHYGRAGLNMLAYDPSEEQDQNLYLFNASARDQAKEELIEDIPKFLCDTGRPILVQDFFEKIYNHTPAHSDDINKAILGSNELDVITLNGGKRRNQITAKDFIEFKKQRSFFFQ